MSAKHVTNGHTPSMILSSEESDTLRACEAMIEKGLQTFIEVGIALVKIRNARLYRQEFTTFEDYCRERWAMTHRRANQLIGAVEVVQNLGTVVPIQPTSERQIRPLAKLEPEQQRDVWQRATRLSPKPTVELVTRIVEKAVADAAADSAIRHEKSKYGGIASLLNELPHIPKVKRTKSFNDWLAVVGAIDDLNEIENFDPDLAASEEFKEFVKERLATAPRAIERINQYLAALERRFPDVLL